MASHDLKAPTNSISIFVGLLRKKVANTLDPKTMNFIDIIDKSAKDMNRLVTSVLDFSNLKNSKTDFTSFSIDELFKDVENNLFSIIQTKEVSINIENKLPSLINGDLSMLKTVFQNLINTAIKFVPESRYPKITIGYKEDASFHIFSISDNGIGIKKEDLEKVF